MAVLIVYIFLEFKLCITVSPVHYSNTRMNVVREERLKKEKDLWHQENHILI